MINSIEIYCFFKQQNLSNPIGTRSETMISPILPAAKKKKKIHLQYCLVPGEKKNVHLQHDIPNM